MELHPWGDVGEDFHLLLPCDTPPSKLGWPELFPPFAVFRRGDPWAGLHFS